MQIQTQEVIKRVGKGFVEGAGIDTLMWALTAYIPELARPSPIPIPGYDPAGIHYDDLLTIAAIGSVIGLGAMKKDWNQVIEGAAMFPAHWMISQFQGVAPRPWTATTHSPVVRDDLIRVD